MNSVPVCFNCRNLIKKVFQSALVWFVFSASMAQAEDQFSCHIKISESKNFEIPVASEKLKQESGSEIQLTNSTEVQDLAIAESDPFPITLVPNGSVSENSKSFKISKDEFHVQGISANSALLGTSETSDGVTGSYEIEVSVRPNSPMSSTYATSAQLIVRTNKTDLSSVKIVGNEKAYYSNPFSSEVKVGQTPEFSINGEVDEIEVGSTKVSIAYEVVCKRTNY